MAGILVLSGLVCACSESESPTSPSAASTGATTPNGNGQASSTGTQQPATTQNGSGQAGSGQTTSGQAGVATTFSLRFHGSGAGDTDRVKVAIDPHVAADVGGDFTVELWLKAEPGANSSTTCQAGNDGWTYGNIIIDRDVAGRGDVGEFGISLSGGRIAFGVGRGGRGQTLCGVMDVSDARWHHVAVTRRASDGQMRIYVDGTESAQGIGPAGDISYRDGRPTGSPQDPFLVLGAAKHDLGAGAQAFSGWVDELRISNRVRYTAPFDRPLAAFTADGETVLLYHFDEGPTGPCASSVLDNSGRSTHGQCRHGGTGTPGPVYAADVPFLPPTKQTRSWLLGNQPNGTSGAAPGDQLLRDPAAPDLRPPVPPGAVPPGAGQPAPVVPPPGPPTSSGPGSH